MSESSAAPVADPSEEFFRAIANPTRRRILDIIAERGEPTVWEIASEFPELVVSGISKHLMMLRASGLVTAIPFGRERRYRLNAEAFSAALSPWLARYEPYFDAALGRLKAFAESGEEPTREPGAESDGARGAAGDAGVG